MTFLFYDFDGIVYVLFPIHDFYALRLDAVSSRTLIHVVHSCIRRLFLRFDFNPPLPTLHFIQPEGKHSRRPRLPFFFEPTVSRSVVVTVLFDEKLHSGNYKMRTHPQVFIATSRLDHADVADPAFRLSIPNNLFLSSALWAAKLHRFISPGGARRRDVEVHTAAGIRLGYAAGAPRTPR